MNAEAKDPVAMAEESAGTKLLKALLTEIHQLQKPWQNTPMDQQRDVIERLRLQVEDAVKSACLTIAARGSKVVQASVESVTFKDGVKAVLQLSRGNPATHELADATGGSVLIVIGEIAEHTDGMHVVKPQPDQLDIDDVDITASEQTAERDNPGRQILDAAAEAQASPLIVPTSNSDYADQYKAVHAIPTHDAPPASELPPADADAPRARRGRPRKDVNGIGTEA